MKRQCGPGSTNESLLSNEVPVSVAFGKQGDCHRLDISVRVVKSLKSRYELAGWRVNVTFDEELNGYRFNFS